MVQKGLDDSGIACVRFDGKVPQKDRQPIVERFKTDPDLRVMLLTLSCGATGFVFDLDSLLRVDDVLIRSRLTLTVASRAYLMEPHWSVKELFFLLLRRPSLYQSKGPGVYLD